MDELTAIQSETKDNLESYIWSMRDKPARRGGYGKSTSSANPGRSPDRWGRLDLLRSGDHLRPGLDEEERELLTADVTAGTATKYRRALDDFDVFLAVRDSGSCSSLLALVLQFVVEAATRYLEWGFGLGELSSGAAGTLVPALRRLVLLAVSLAALVPDSTLHFRAVWRLHESWLLAVPPKFSGLQARTRRCRPHHRLRRN